MEALYEAEDALVQIFVVHPDIFELLGELIAQRALHDVQIVMQQQWSRTFFGLLPDVGPQVGEEIHIGCDIFLGLAFARRPDNEPAGSAAVMRLQNAFQAQAFFVARDFAGDARVFHGGHVNDVASRKSDMRSDARALLAQRLLRDLNDNFLAFLQKFADGGHRGAFRPTAAAGLFGTGGACFHRWRGRGCGFGSSFLLESVVYTCSTAASAAHLAPHSSRHTMAIASALLADLRGESLCGRRLLWLFGCFRRLRSFGCF